MAPHRYAVGQSVDFVPGPYDGNVPRGAYVIERQLPSETRDWQYRIRNSNDGHERVVLESQLRARSVGPLG
jgi:hypothetical protein